MESNLEISPELADFALTHLEFATWHPRHEFEQPRIMLTSRNGGWVGCSLSAFNPDLGMLAVGAVGPDPYQAVSRAATILEAEVNRRVQSRRVPPSSAVPAARPSETRLPIAS